MKLRRLLTRALGALLVVVLAYITAVVALGLAYLSITPVSTLMLGRWLTLRPVTRVVVPLAGIAPVLPLAVMASEDARFCIHHGVDWGALREVMEEDEGPGRGASTIPMQVAKNLFLWSGRSYVRKALELPIALYLDLLWSKRRMMEVYLNVAEWGPGIFGAEAAARRHFGKSARDLSAREAALLASALPNPILRDPGRPSPRHARLASRLLGRMTQFGALASCLRA